MEVDTHSKVSPPSRKVGARKLGSANYLNQQRLAQSCVANEVIARISLRWKMSVLFAIDNGARTFAELKRTHPTLSDHILASRLRELRREGLIAKDERSDRHPVYGTTARGASLLEIVGALCAWGEEASA
jgi:DNA-binding HxlR family transcriptional regulator